MFGSDTGPPLGSGNAAGWTQQTYITADTQYLNARVTDRFLEYFSRTAAAAAKYDKEKDKLFDPYLRLFDGA